MSECVCVCEGVVNSSPTIAYFMSVRKCVCVCVNLNL